MSEKPFVKFRRRDVLKTSAMALGGALLVGDARDAYPKAVNTNSSPSTLKITDLRVAIVVKPGPSPCPIIRIDTNQGVYGLGEVRDGASATYALFLKSRIVGENPLQLDKIFRKIKQFGGHARQGGGVSAIEMALWDIAGKAASLPVYRLLGGKAREAAPLNWTVGQQSPSQMAEEAAFYVENHRVRSIRLKIGRPGNTDEQACEEVRNRIGPAVTMRVDANEYYQSAKEAIVAIRRLERFNLQLVEQPLAAHDYAGHAEVRSAVVTPIGLDESIQSPRDALRAIQARSGDVFNVYVSESGGLLRAQQIVAIAEAAGIPCLVGTMGELQIASAAAVHLAVACANIPMTCDLVGPLRYNESIIQETLRIEDGLFYPPEGPGLGVTPNWDVIDRWRV
jgi:L-Ala-D/L-Glu epimerase / N-acetyl-D-glutamate racemase